jgi:hypothetical protein
VHKLGKSRVDLVSHTARIVRAVDGPMVRDGDRTAANRPAFGRRDGSRAVRRQSTQRVIRLDAPVRGRPEKLRAALANKIRLAEAISALRAARFWSAGSAP